jgi:hypothetical protein
MRRGPEWHGRRRPLGATNRSWNSERALHMTASTPRTFARSPPGDKKQSVDVRATDVMLLGGMP